MPLSEDAPRYAVRGFGVTAAAHRAGGVTAYWSAGDDSRFAGALRRCELAVQTLRVPARDTTGPMHTLDLATRRR
jgi:hypothetical protein